MSLLLQLPPGLKKSLDIQVKLFQKVGLDLYAYDENYALLKRYGLLLFCNIMFCILTFLQWYYVFAETDADSEHFLEKASSFSTALSFTQDIIIFLLITLKKTQIQEVFVDIAEVWPDGLEGKKMKIFNDWLRLLYLFNKWYAVSMASAIVVVFFSQLSVAFICLLFGVNDDETRVLHIIYPFKTNSTLRLLAVFIFEFVTCGTLHICVNASFVMLMFTLTYNVSTLLRVLQIDIESCIKPRQRERNCLSNEEEVILKIVKTHQKLLRIADKLKNIFSPIIFVPICVSSFILCLYSFIITASEGVTAIIHVIGVFVVFFGLLSLIWPGQFLIDMSSGVAEAAYRSLWYETCVQARKYILTIITRSQKPAHLTALGFVTITLSVMFKILNTTWSFATLVNQMYQKRGGSNV